MAELTRRDFPQFMREVTGFDPFPWQVRLLARVLDDGWPALIDLPTGAGKTNAMLIALFAHALEPTRFPRRIILVVDRRTIVDQVAAFGEKILAALACDTHTVSPEVAARLEESAGAGTPALRVVQLRGGVPRDDSWITSPRQPMLIASTVDQVGSRLLFRGYGVSEGMRPVHAGILSHDSLVFLDEVHLATAFEETLTVLRERYRGWADVQLPLPVEVVRLSATPRGVALESSRVFALQAEDRDHPVLKVRLGAPRPATLVEVKTRNVRDASEERAARREVAHEAAARAIEALSYGHLAVGVIVNRVDTASTTAALLRRTEGLDADVVLLTGRMRPLDRRAVDLVLRQRVGAGVERRAGERPLVVVATQCIEAGADYDFDALVSECASLDALRQRFGRLNRLGLVQGPRAWVLMRKDQARELAKPDPIYENAMRETWNYLNAVAHDGCIDFGLLAFPQPDDADAMLPPSVEAPLLFPSYLDAWAQTRPTPHPNPDVALWLHGKGASRSSDAQLVFRAGLPEIPPQRLPDARELNTATQILDWIPPCTSEALSIPIHELKRWLARVPIEIEGGDVTGRAESEPQNGDPGSGGAWLWTSEGCSWITTEEIRPGHTIVVPASAGGLDSGNWNPEARGPVPDLGEIANFVTRGRIQIRLTETTLPTGLPHPIPTPPSLDDEEFEEARKSCEQWLRLMADDLESSDEWKTIFEALGSAGRALGLRILADETGSSMWLAGVKRADVRDVSTEESVSSFVGQEVTLAAHSHDVEAWAIEFVARSGLPNEIQSDVRLAALVHDIGKAHPRFQALLCGGDPIRASARLEPLAKSALPEARISRERAADRAKWPAGLRHELFSLRLFDASAELQERANDPDLVRHLIASHHGWCRPWPPAVFDDSPTEIHVELDQVEMAITSDALDPTISGEAADRFARLNARYGWHGLAYLEALLRLADQNASARPLQRPGKSNEGNEPNEL